MVHELIGLFGSQHSSTQDRMGGLYPRSFFERALDRAGGLYKGADRPPASPTAPPAQVQGAASSPNTASGVQAPQAQPLVPADQPSQQQQQPPPPAPGRFKPSPVLSSISDPSSPMAPWTALTSGRVVPQAPPPTQAQNVARGQQMFSNQTLQKSAAKLAAFRRLTGKDGIIDALARQAVLEKAASYPLFGGMPNQYMTKGGMGGPMGGLYAGGHYISGPSGMGSGPQSWAIPPGGPDRSPLGGFGMNAQPGGGLYPRQAFAGGLPGMGGPMGGLYGRQGGMGAAPPARISSTTSAVRRPIGRPCKR